MPGSTFIYFDFIYRQGVFLRAPCMAKFQRIPLEASTHVPLFKYAMSRVKYTISNKFFDQYNGNF